MKKKIVVLILLMGCLLLTSITSANAFDTYGFKSKTITPIVRFTTIYVDDDNTQGPWDGTLEHPYQHIEDGVDNASEGDTVFVFNGVYNKEQIYVRKTIKLVGEDKDNTIIYGPYFQVLQVNGFELHNFCFNDSQPIFMYDCSNCIISGIIILDFYSGAGISLTNCSNCILSDNSIQAYHYGACIELRAKSVNNKIKNNNLYGCNLEGMDQTTGICITHDSNDSTVENNIINNFDGTGIEVHYNSRVIITDNIINNTKYGVDILFSSKHTISGNKITNNSQGIALGFSDNVTISYNIIKENSVYGISLANGKNIDASYNIIDNNPCGIAFCFIENSICSNNTVTNSSEIGIDIMDSGDIDNNNFISYNNVKYCYCGIMLEQSWGNNYRNNTVSFNEIGITVYGAAKFNVITKNEVGKNGIGVMLYGFIQGKTYAPVGNLVVGNNIFENYYCGAYATVLTRFNQIYYNNLIDNDLNAFDNGTNIWYKSKITGGMGNYWDDYTGSDSNGDGIGDSPYDVPPLPFRNKDRYPCIEPIDLGNIPNSYTELIQISQQSQPQVNPYPKQQIIRTLKTILQINPTTL